MAFQTSAIPAFATVTSEIWPSLSGAMSAPWRVLGQKAHGAPSPSSRRDSQLSSLKVESKTTPISHSYKPQLPDCLRDLPLSFSSSVTPKTFPNTRYDIRSIVSTMQKGTIAAANPIARRGFMPHLQSRQLSTAVPSRFQQPDSILTIVAKHQRRTLFSSTPRSTLAFLEESANKKPQDASKQYTFYQALLRANLPSIVIERYQSQRFASNPSCENLYHQALGALGQGSAAMTGQAQLGNQTSNLNNNQLQAIGQAVAASSQGGNIGISRTSGSGAKDAPLYVVVEETIGSTIFKWFKFLLYFCVFTYLSLVVVNMIIDSLQTVKKIGGKGDNEAKAEHQNVRFSDVHGCDEAKEELQELVDFLKNPDKFSTLGGKLPKGVLLVGPPGTGKTLLARAVAGEAGVPFFFMSGSEFDEIYVGVGAKRVRELFASAKAKSPAIVFIDELDAIGGKRNARDANYVKQTLNQLLTELDGFDQNSGVIILGATNFPESLDKALTRPGRFDRNVVVGLPDVRGRLAILKHHMKKIPIAKDVSMETLASGTPGFSGAELENVVNQAAVHASKAKATAVSMLDFEWAKDKVMMGAERKSMVISQKEKEMTAYHEAGHALVLMFTRGAEPLHKVTIMPRGQALGLTFHLPEMDKYSVTLDEYRAKIDVCMGGKVAEEIVYGPDSVTSGVASDLKQATRLAYAMVTAFGMSEKLGNVDLASNHDTLSVGTRELIESEVRRLIEEGRSRAVNLLQTRRAELDRLAKALVEYETLNREEAFKVIRGEKLEGRMIMPAGTIKLPDMPSVGIELPKLPGTAPEQPTEKPPPQGGAVA